MTTYLDLEDLLVIAQAVLGEVPRVRDYGLLASAAARPATFVGGRDAYGDVATKAAALLHSLCSNHPLVDGNKRLAWSAAVVFAALNAGKPVPEVDTDRAEAFVVAVASGADDVSVIATELRRLGVIPGGA